MREATKNLSSVVAAIALASFLSFGGALAEPANKTDSHAHETSLKRKLANVLILLRASRLASTPELACKAEILLDDCIAEQQATKSQQLHDKLYEVKKGLGVLCTDQLTELAKADELTARLEENLEQILQTQQSESEASQASTTIPMNVPWLLAGLAAGLTVGWLVAFRKNIEPRTVKESSEETNRATNVGSHSASTKPELQRSISQSYSIIDEILPLASSSRDLAYFDNVPAGLLSVNEDGTIRSANARIAALIGVSVSSLKGKMLTQFLSPDQNAFSTSLDKLKLTLSAGTEAWLKTEAGTLIPVDLSCANFATKTKQGMLVSVVDRSARQEIEDLRKHFVSVVSHDLRTPLTSLGLFFQILKQSDSFESDDYKEAVVDAEQETARLIKLVTDLLDVSKLESGNFALDFARVDASALASSAMASVARVASDKGVATKITCDSVEIEVDADRVVQALVNLLSNAVHFSPPQSTVTLSGELVGSSFCFSVSDQGEGVPEHERELIFDRFTQATKHRKEGAGLGLAICKLIAQQHNGTIDVTEATGGGAKFRLSLPRSVADGRTGAAVN